MEISEGRNCNKCGAFKPWEEFAINRLGINGRHSICKSCKNESNRVKERARKASKPKETYEQRRQKLLKYVYGMSQEDYDTMLQRQDYKCAICGLSENKVGKHFFVDHCHSTGIVRGLLCYHCNTLLGMSRDNVDVLTSAISYLRNSNGQK